MTDKTLRDLYVEGVAMVRDGKHIHLDSRTMTWVEDEDDDIWR